MATAWEFDRLLKRYKRDHNDNVAGEIRRRREALSKSAARRLKDRKALSKLKKREAAREERARWRERKYGKLVWL